jgi:hypothetical protein
MKVDDVRLVRWLSVPLVMTLLVLLTLVEPAAAHKGVALTVHDDGRGNVSVDVVWADGHPVSETIGATMVGFSDRGAQLGPVPLTRLPGTPTVVHGTPLAAGRWTVTVDVAVPGVGHCEAVVTVADPPAPGRTRCGDVQAAPATTPAAAPAGWPLWATVLLGVAGLVVAAGLVVLMRRPGHPGRTRTARPRR